MSSIVAAMMVNDAATRALRAERAVVAGQLRGVIDSSRGLRTDSVGVHPGIMYCTSNVSRMIDELDERVRMGLDAIQSLRDDNARLQREIEVERGIKKEEPFENVSSHELVMELKRRDWNHWLQPPNEVITDGGLKDATSRKIVHELKTRVDYLKTLADSLSPQDVSLLARAKGMKGLVKSTGGVAPRPYLARPGALVGSEYVPRGGTAIAVIEKHRRSARLAAKNN